MGSVAGASPILALMLYLYHWFVFCVSSLFPGGGGRIRTYAGVTPSLISNQARCQAPARLLLGVDPLYLGDLGQPHVRLVFPFLYFYPVLYVLA